jgi:glycosyltransferase involved in cell wall biosynthesis
MRVLWICRLPQVVQEEIFDGEDHGAQTALSWIVAHLPPPEDVELHLACLWPGGDRPKTVEYEGARIHLLPCPRRGRALLFFQRDTTYFRSLFEELEPEIVHGWGTEDSCGLVARKLDPLHNVVGIQGLIHTYHQHLPKSLRTLLVRFTERLTLKKARNVVAESHYSLDSAAPLCPSAVKRVIEHPLRHELLSSPPTGGTHKTALFVGLIQERKGMSEAIEAFAKVAPAEWKLHVVGRGTLEYEKRMYDLVSRLGINSRFRHSRVLDISSLVKAMQESSILLLPTHVDTGPTALKEALTMGLWPVCYDNSGPGEYVRKYGFGSLARDGDVNSLSSELKRCLINMPWRDANERAVLARKTRIDFSPEEAWNQLTEFYAAILSHPRERGS